MGEKAMKSDRDSETCQKVHHDEERQVKGAEVSAPEKHHGRNDTERRQKNHHNAYHLQEKAGGLHSMHAFFGTGGREMHFY
jgi:hypothetical protein